MPDGAGGRPLAAKLGIKDGHRVLVVGAPEGWALDGLPPAARVSRRVSTATVDVVVAFFTDLASLDRYAPRLGKAMAPDGALWLAWPRRAAGHASDITDNRIRAALLPLGLVDVKVAALDEDWSGLKMVRRRELRGRHGSAPGSSGRHQVGGQHG